MKSLRFGILSSSDYAIWMRSSCEAFSPEVCFSSFRYRP
jgi:hypothetical protein